MYTHTPPAALSICIPDAPPPPIPPRPTPHHSGQVQTALQLRGFTDVVNAGGYTTDRPALDRLCGALGPPQVSWGCGGRETTADPTANPTTDPGRDHDHGLGGLHGSAGSEGRHTHQMLVSICGGVAGMAVAGTLVCVLLRQRGGGGCQRRAIKATTG